MDDLILEIRSSFIEETKELLDEYQDVLDSGKQDLSTEDVSKIFRIIHTIKGNSKACDFVGLSNNIHKYEDYLNKTRDVGISNQKHFSDVNYDILGELFKIMETITEDMKEEPSYDHLATLIQNIDSAPSAGSAKQETMRVLILDDEEDLITVQKDIISEQFKGVEIDSFNNGKEGLSAIDEKKYDVIISDYQMPEMDGNQFLKELRSNKALRNHDTPVVLSSAYRPPVMDSAEIYDKVFFLSKPFTAKSLLYYLYCALRS